MTSNGKRPSRVPMWKGVKSAYLLIGLCLFPLAIGGYWAYGHIYGATFSLFHIHIPLSLLLQIKNPQICPLLMCVFHFFSPF